MLNIIWYESCNIYIIIFDWQRGLVKNTILKSIIQVCMYTVEYFSGSK